MSWQIQTAQFVEKRNLYFRHFLITSKLLSDVGIVWNAFLWNIITLVVSGTGMLVTDPVHWFWSEAILGQDA